MKTILCIILFLCASMLFAEVLFYDNFNRSDGAVGNSWTNIGSATTAIENNAMIITSPNGTGVKRDFTPITSGVVYIQYDWKVVSTDWYADAFPTGLITHLTMDTEGNLSYDVDGTMISPVLMQNSGLGIYANIRLMIDLDTDFFSVWINDVLAAENIAGNPISSFSSFTFRGLGASTVQYVDNFILMNCTPPEDFTAIGHLNDIELSWTPSPYPEIVTYQVLRDTTSLANIVLTEIPGTQTTFTDNTAEPNTDYFYRIRTILGGSVFTDYSEEVTAHLHPQISVSPQNITFNVGYGYSDSTYITIGNTGNYPLEWNIKREPIGFPSTNGLVAYYPFNGNTDDESGNDFHLNNYGAEITADNAGNPGQAYHFNGNTYLETDSNMGIGCGDVTISAWYRPLSIAHSQITVGSAGIVSTYDFASQIEYTLFHSGDPFLFGGQVHKPYNLVYTLNSNYELGIWHHMTFVKDQDAIFLYINGLLVGSTSILHFTQTPITSVRTRIGKGAATTMYNSIIGDVDEIFVYNRPISSDEVMSLYLNTLSGHLSVYPSRGVIDLGNSQSVNVKVHTELLDVGSHVDTLYVITNDPYSPVIPIVITTNVLPPNPVITPDPLNVNLNVENPIREVPIQIHNLGQGKLVFNLSGMDDYGIQSNSILGFNPIFGQVGSASSSSVILTTNGSHLIDGNYDTSIQITAEGGAGPWYFPVTVNVDYTPPLAVTGLAIDDAATNDDQIGFTWWSNAIADSVIAYKIFRRGAEETEWQLKATVPSSQLSYIDSDFGNFVDTYQFYRVRAVDWVGNISAVGDSVMGALNRFLNPENMVIQNISNRDIHLSWDIVMETISGTPGTPSCYVIYKSQYPTPITDFDFLSISFTNEFTHEWALHFQPLNRLFYVVTAYGGDMGRMQSLVAQKTEWKYGELEQMLNENGIQHLDVIK